MLVSYRTLPRQGFAAWHSSLHTDASWRRVLIRHEVFSQATVVAAAMATEEPLLGDTETGQSPAIAHQDTQTTLYGALDDKTISETKHDKDMQEDKKKYLVEDYKSAMYDISRFASEGAQLSGNADESKDGSDGGAEDSKKPEGAASASAPAPAPAAPTPA